MEIQGISHIEGNLSQFMIFNMELYHKTLIPPTTHSHAYALHLEPIKPKEEHDRPKQLLLATTNSLQLYRHQMASPPSPPANASNPSNPSSQSQHQSSPSHKYALRPFHTEQLFSNICAVEAIIYRDDDLRKDIVVVTLSNGKYELLEWLSHKAQFAVIDQGLIFSQEEQVHNGLTKPIPGQYISVNNEALLVVIASTRWDFKVYSRELGIQGMRLETLYHHQRLPEIERVSICRQLAPGHGNNSLFYSLRTELKQGEKVVSLFKMKRTNNYFEEEPLVIEDQTVQLLIPRTGENNFFLVAEKSLYYSCKGKLAQLKIPQSKPCLPVSWWRRPLREKKEEFFIINENGEVLIVAFDDSSANPCSVHFIEAVAPTLAAAALDRNLFFLLTTGQEYLLVEAVGKYRCEERCEKTRASSKIKDEKEKEVQSLRELEVVGVMSGGRLIRDMKICNVEGSMNNQILLTGGRPNSKRGFLSIIRYGLKLRCYLSVNSTVPVGIWTVKRHVANKHHSFIVMSYSSRKTVTFLLDSNKMIQNNELRLDEDELTMNVTRFGDNSLVQVKAFSLKYITKEGSSQSIKIRGRVMKAASVQEGKQLLLSFIGGYFEYFEVCNGELRKIKEMSLDPQANQIEFSPPEMVDGRPFSKYVAAGFTNYHIRLYALGKGLEVINSHNFKVSIESLAFMPQGDDSLCLHVGAQFGRHFKWNIHSKTGQDIDIQDDVFGDKSIKYQKLSVAGKTAIFRTTPEPHLTYQWQGQTQSCALPLSPIELCTEMNLEGKDGTTFVTFYEGYLRIIEIHGFDSLLYTDHKDLELSGRKILLLEERVGLLTEAKVMLADKQVWMSKFLFLNPLKDYETESSINFESNQKVLSAASLSHKEDKNLICFGCCLGHTSFPKPTARFPTIRIYSYEYTEGKPTVSHLFNFSLDHPPTAMTTYFGKLLVGVDRKLILFDIFKQKLVSRAISDTLASTITSIHVDGQKIFLTQVMQSFSMLRINHKTKCFQVVGQDVVDRFTTCSCLMDGEGGLMAGGDKFGNFFVSKITEKIKTDFEEIKENNVFQASVIPNFMESLVNYHLGEIPTAIQNGRVDLKKPERIFYATIDGRVGMLYPMDGDEEDQLELLLKLEQEMGKSSLSGATNHRLHRNYFNPSKGVVDGDFCELFLSLPEPERVRLSSSLGKEPQAIAAILSEMQSKFS